MIELLPFIPKEILNTVNDIYGMNYWGPHDYLEEDKNIVIASGWLAQLRTIYFTKTVYIAAVHRIRIEVDKTLPTQDRTLSYHHHSHQGLLLVGEAAKPYDRFSGSNPLHTVEIEWPDSVTSALQMLPVLPNQDLGASSVIRRFDTKGFSFSQGGIILATFTRVSQNVMYVERLAVADSVGRLVQSLLEMVDSLAEKYDDVELSAALNARGFGDIIL